AEFLADDLHLQHHLAGDGARLRIRGDHIECRAGERGNRVEAEVPPELHPDIRADIRAHGRFHPGIDQQAGQAARPLAPLPRRLADGKTIPRHVSNDAGRGDLGGLVDHGAKDPLRPDAVPDRAVRIDGLYPQAFPRPGDAIEIPPRHAVLRRHHHRLGSEQGLHRRDDAADGMCFEGDDDVILMAERGGIIRCRDIFYGESLPLTFNGEAVFADRGKMLPARNQGDFRLALPRQQIADQPADRARAIDADFHQTSPSFSASPMRCSLPVAPFGISSSSVMLRGTLKAARLFAAKSRSSASVATLPSLRTIAAATSSPSLSWGSAKVTTCATAG